MELRWERNPEHEQATLKLYKDAGMLGDTAPVVHYGFDANGRECLRALLSYEPWEPGDDRWHLSISAPERVPTWEEIASTVHALRPGVPFVMGIPPRSWWLNKNSNVLHLWETKDRAMLDEWRRNRAGDAPD